MHICNTVHPLNILCDKRKKILNTYPSGIKKKHSVSIFFVNIRYFQILCLQII